MVRIGIIGAGMITTNSHLPSALSLNNCRVTAIVDPVIERAESLISGFAIKAKAATSVDEIMGEVDAVIIATPNNTHRDLAVRCLKHGVSTLIEKPLANSVAEGSEIVSAARQSGAIVATGYSNRFRDSVVFLRELIHKEYFGRVRRFVHQFGSAGGWSPLSAYNLDRRATGGGALVVTGTHFLDRMMFIWGYPIHAGLTLDTLEGPEGDCTAHFEYDTTGGRFSGIARYSKTCSLPSGLVIDTERGMVMLRDSPNAEIMFREHAHPEMCQILRRRESPVFDPLVSEFRHQIENLVNAVETGAKPWVDGEEGLLSLRLIENLYANSRISLCDWYERRSPEIEQ
jgi:predicted dehydrogenase